MLTFLETRTQGKRVSSCWTIWVCFNEVMFQKKDMLTNTIVCMCTYVRSRPSCESCSSSSCADWSSPREVPGGQNLSAPLLFLLVCPVYNNPTRDKNNMDSKNSRWDPSPNLAASQDGLMHSFEKSEPLRCIPRHKCIFSKNIQFVLLDGSYCRRLTPVAHSARHHSRAEVTIVP